MRDKNRFGKLPRLSMVGLALLSLGYAMPALAQDAASDADKEGANKLDKVVVTAQGRRENPVKVPYNITAVGGDDLAEKQIVDQYELVKNVAGASTVDRGYRNSGVLGGVTLRGLNANGSNLGDYQASAVSTVSAYTNQTPILANFLIKDVERVEILRGPQGTLYGSGSLGGTLRYITNAPKLGKLQGKVEGSFSKTNGSDGQNMSGDFVINAPLGETVALRVSGGGLKNDGLIDYVSAFKVDAKGIPVAPKGVTDPAAEYAPVKDADWVDIRYGRAALLFKPNREFRATLTLQTQRDKTGGRRAPSTGNNGFGVPYGPYENGAVILEPSERTVDLQALEMELDLGFATLTSASSLTNQNGSSTSDGTGRYAKFDWLRDYYSNYPRPVIQAHRTYGDKSKVQEFRLISKKGDVFDYITGIYYQDQTLKAWQNDSVLGFTNWAAAAKPGLGVTTDVNWSFDRVQRFTTKSAYGELTYHFAPKWHATGGARLFSNNFENSTILGSPIWGYKDETSKFSTKENGKLFKGNLSYELAENKLLYGTISQGYRRGGANAVGLVGTFKEDPRYQPYQSDKSTNFELGFKGTHEAMRFSVAAFHIDWDKIQIDAASRNWGYFVAVNGGKAKSQGLELELGGDLSDSLHYTFSYGFVNAKLVDPVLDPVYPTRVMGAAGTRLPGTAKNTASATLEHVSSPKAGFTWVNRVTAYYQSATENSIDPSPKFAATWPAFSQFGLSSTLSGHKWSATLFVKNVTNNKGVTGGSLEASQGTQPSNNFNGNNSRLFISQPRTVGVSAAYEF